MLGGTVDLGDYYSALPILEALANNNLIDYSSYTTEEETEHHVHIVSFSDFHITANDCNYPLTDKSEILLLITQ